MALANITLRSPYVPYSIYLRGTVALGLKGWGLLRIESWAEGVRAGFSISGCHEPKVKCWEFERFIPSAMPARNPVSSWEIKTSLLASGNPSGQP